jgi:hypothetical protein
MSDLVQEIKAAGYQSLDQLESDLKAGAKHVIDFEEEQKGGELFFADIGAARRALSGVSDSFVEVRLRANEKSRRRSKARPK